MGKKMKRTRKLWLSSATLVFFLIIIFLVIIESPTSVENLKEQQHVSTVSYVEVGPQSLPMNIYSVAEIKPLWNTTIKAQTSGQITRVFDAALAGESVKQNDPLIEIEPSQYRANLDEARRLVAEAELNLALEKNKAMQAKTNWQNVDIALTASDLALNIPQQKAAEKALVAAKSQEKAALVRYHNTQVKAPFSGVISARHISLGQAVSEGEDLLTIQGQRLLEIEVLISKQQRRRLAENWREGKAKIIDMEGKLLSHAKIQRNSGVLDPKTRQYKIFLAVEQSAGGALTPGDFVKVELPGKTAHNALAIPASALSGDGYIWYLDKEDKLRRFFAAVLFYQNNLVVIEPPILKNASQSSSLRVATMPLASFLSSMKVKPEQVDIPSQEH